MGRVKKNEKPVLGMEKEAVKEEMDIGFDIGLSALRDHRSRDEKDDRYHNTKYLLKQYRRVEYAVKVSEAELNMRMEMEHGARLSTLEVNAELAGIDLEGTKLERYAQSLIRSKNMLQIIRHSLELVKADPDNGELLYEILYYNYISPKKPKNREEILAKLEEQGYPLAIATYHLHLRAAIKALDSIMWGYTARNCLQIIKNFAPEF